MAQEFKLLFVLCLVAASLGTSNATTPSSANPTTAGGASNATTPSSANPTTAGGASNATTPSSANPTTAGGASNATAPSSANPTTSGGASNATAPPSASPTTAGGASNATAPPSASPTTAGGASNATAPPSASPTTAGGASNATAPPSASPTTAGGASNATAPPSASPTTAGGASNATAPPSASPTTAGGASNATAPPSASPTTAGGSSNATAPPSASPTTAGGASNATAPPAESPTTAGGASDATPAPTTQPTNATSEITTTTQPASNPCATNPCGQGSTCEPRANSTFLCLCSAGDFYNDESQSCVNAKVFPGQLQISEITYSAEMADQRSEEFLEAAVKINNALEDSFNRSDFSGSTVLEIREVGSRVWSRAANGVIATVEIFFKASSTITTEEFKKEMIAAANCGNCVLKGANFSESPLCDNKTCDAETTSCDAKDGVLSCDCLGDYIKTNFSDRICIACPSGEKPTKDRTDCEECPFGYSGLNCKESWQLILVIVGSVLGGLLLITLIVLPVVAMKSSKKSSKKSKYADAGEPYISPLPVKTPLGNSGIANSQAAPLNRSTNAFANAGMPRIPRATTSSSWDRTSLEMTPSNSRQNLVPAGRNSRLYEDQDDMAPYAQSRPQSSLYGQARPQNNPYAQSRPQANPYSSSQGVSNPYYTHDNERRFN